MTEDDVYRHYLGEVIVGWMYNSPIPGRDDYTPSFGLFELRNKVRWKDFGLPDQFGWDAENLVQYMEGFPLTNAGYHKARKFIETQLVPGTIGKTLPRLTRSGRKLAGYVKTRDYEARDLAYWARFDLNIFDLIDNDIEAVESVVWSGAHGKFTQETSEDDPMFIYWWNRNPASWKLYRPLAPEKKLKFRQENVSNVIEGYNDQFKQQTYDRIVFASSTKDRLVLKKAFLMMGLNYGVLNPRGEGDRSVILMERTNIEALAPRITILYDADDVGFETSQVLVDMIREGSGEERWDYVDMRKKLEGQKDFSDYVDKQRGNHSYRKLINILKNVL